MGFLINSRVHRFIATNPDLSKCQIPIRYTDYHFLAYDSYIDCSELFWFENDDLAHLRGEIRPSTKQAIIKAVSTASTIPEKYRILITET